MKKNEIYYNLTENYAIKITEIGFHQVTFKRIKDNCRAKMNQCSENSDFVDLLYKLSKGNWLQIYNPKKMMLQVRYYKGEYPFNGKFDEKLLEGVMPPLN